MIAQHGSSEQKSFLVARAIPWRIIPLHTPRVWRRCRRCDRQRPFASSDRFRVNANQRRIDVWLIYRCSTCEATWNREILARVVPQDIGQERYDRFVANDLQTAWERAFDLPGLASLGVRVDADVSVRVERGDAPLPAPDDRVIVRLEMPYPCRIRLDKLLANELKVARSRLARLYRAGALQVRGGPARPLRKPAQPGQIVVLADGECGPMARSDRRIE